MPAETFPTIPKVLASLALRLNTEVKNHSVEIPADQGSGYCTGYVFTEHLRLLILNYELKEDLILENPDVASPTPTILFKFQHVLVKTGLHSLKKRVPSVLIATSQLHTESVISIHSNTEVINIEVDAHYLKGLFTASEKSPILRSLLTNTQPLIFEELVHPPIQKIIDELVNQPISETFELFWARIKAEELICQLLIALEKREEKQVYALNSQDVEAIYRAKEHMLAHLDTPPVINELALAAHMSPTKLKRLFKQIFGNSIFSYYQEFRMKEAARLLQAEQRSVSEVGYALGFTNLSHFSKVFYEHIGTKPKQFSRIKPKE
ncbi:AraC family transcriptional regulator [Siphonobacter sp. SORGH_AS_0500]|uniref:helix-turn-helix transcriptional regulator n=1 Tax=Siphonobacter sp. SORGH_AS_0500 TaxID=1864824 RepID=UPI00285A4D5D|nr:AraC family transcriptional regulator [Siphonobacter sp. SORGH_AS_0500]MDR6197998.1 AraC-like DNA-binding protein [Siphonobacter sp. SORGH_AS_0500]